MEEQLLTVKEVAKRLNLCGRMVYKLSTIGAMPRPLKIGRSTRWRAADVAAWIDGGCRPVGEGKGGGHETR